MPIYIIMVLLHSTAGAVPENLQEAKLRLWSNEKCKESYSYITDKMICAGYNSGHVSTCIVSRVVCGVATRVGAWLCMTAVQLYELYEHTYSFIQVGTG